MLNDINIYNQIVYENLIDSIRRILTIIQTKELEDFCISIYFDINHQNIFLSNNSQIKIIDGIGEIKIDYNFLYLKVGEDGFSILMENQNDQDHLFIPYFSIIKFSDEKNDFSLDFSLIYTIEPIKKNSEDNIIFVDV